jgi:hypothetical protein
LVRLKSQGQTIPSLEAAEGMAGLASTGGAEASEAMAEAVVVFSDIESLVFQSQCVFPIEFFFLLFRIIFYFSSFLADSFDVNNLIGIECLFIR